MKLEIELDLNKIDYDAINKQIEEKIINMDLEKSYSISTKIESKISEEVDKEVGRHLKKGGWYGDLNDNSKRNINDEINKNIARLVKTNVEEIFNKIPTDELNKLISDLIPKVLMDVIINQVSSSYFSYHENSRNVTLDICEERIRSMIQNRLY